MTILPVQTDPPAYEPTTAQLERAVSLRRFNWFYVYIPLGLAGLGILVLVVLLLWGTLSPHILGTREFASGLADVVVILAIVPLLLLCAIVPLATIGFYIYRRQQPKREHGRIQPLFWRLDALVDKVRGKAKTTIPKAAEPIIAGNSRIAYWRTLFENIRNIFTRR